MVPLAIEIALPVLTKLTDPYWIRKVTSWTLTGCCGCCPIEMKILSPAIMLCRCQNVSHNILSPTHIRMMWHQPKPGVMHLIHALNHWGEYIFQLLAPGSPVTWANHRVPDVHTSHYSIPVLPVWGLKERPSLLPHPVHLWVRVPLPFAMGKGQRACVGYDA